VTAAGVVSTLLAAVMTWPTLRHPIGTIPADTYDPTLQAWQVAWGGHALRHDPSGIWTANATFPEHLSLAFSDSLLGYAPFGLIGSGPAAAIFRYNVLFALSFAVASFGLYVLARQLGAGRAASVVVAVAFAYSPWRFAHAGHLNILSTGGIPLALALLARGHDWSLRAGHRPALPRPLWAFAGWLTAAAQVSLGFGLGIPFVYVLAGVSLITAISWLRSARFSRPGRLIQADLAGGALFLLITALLAHPYLQVLAEHHDARRSVAWLDLLSPPWRGFFVAGEHSWLWGSALATPRAHLTFAGEMEILPGFTLILLAGYGLVRSAWSRRTRTVLALGVAVTAWLAMGTTTAGHGRFGYLLLYRFLPGFDGSRTPGRLVLWTILLLCLLAAGALTTNPGSGTKNAVLQRELLTTTAKDTTLQTELTLQPELLTTTASELAITKSVPSSAVLSPPSTSMPPGPPTPTTRSRPWSPLRILALSLVLIAVIAEGIDRTPHPTVPTTPVSLVQFAAPILVLPTDELSDLHVMLWSTDQFPTVVNGSSGYNPPTRQELRDAMTTFPDQRSVDVLRRIGVRTVLVTPEAVGTPYESALGRTGSQFGLTRTDQNGVAVFTL
jgi:hypothetical protein